LILYPIGLSNFGKDFNCGFVLVKQNHLTSLINEFPSSQKFFTFGEEREKCEILTTFMMKTQHLFLSCVDSRIQDQGSMYARFHLGTFFKGQSLTFANALRRNLLSEIPGMVITDVSLKGATHEFATLPGVEETVLEILLNLKNLVFVPCQSSLTELKNFQATGFLKTSGPTKVTGKDLKLPLSVKCVNQNAHIANITSNTDFAIRFDLQIRRPKQNDLKKSNELGKQQTRKFVFDTVPSPVQKVNYVIKSLNVKQGSEYVVLEVWTDGSVSPQESVQFGLKNLTQLFYQFASMKQVLI
jgi:DNA-directed RNA polymerase subunit alpha